MSARLELPLNREPYPFAIFAHVFTGNKNLSAARHISKALSANGIAVLRFDFTGLGDSDGEFSETNFSSNVSDIETAAEWLSEHYQAPELLVGQSLGGAASVFAASRIDSVKAVVTIGAPSNPQHVAHLLRSSEAEIEETGSARVSIAGREFCIKKQFLDDLNSQNMFEVVRKLKKAILIIHSPQDMIVEIENAAELYRSAKHPKSFVTLDGSDHMISNKEDAHYVGNVIASWVKRYVSFRKEIELKTEKQVVARLDDDGFTTDILAGIHTLIADEPEGVGGNNFGPSPYELLNAALGACTVMTLQMYAKRKKWDLQEVKVHLDYTRSYEEDCENCEDKGAKIDHYIKHIEFKGELSEIQKNRLMEIAERCPVNKTLKSPGKHPAH